MIQGTGTRRSRSVSPFPKRRFNHEWTLIDTNRRTTDDTDWQEGTGRALLGAICGSPGRESRFQRWWFSDFDNPGALPQGSTETAALALNTPAKTTWSAAADALQHWCPFVVNTRKNRKNFSCSRWSKSKQARGCAAGQGRNREYARTKRADRDRLCRSVTRSEGNSL